MVIYSQRMAALLMLRGFVLQGMERNHDGTGKNVFFFKDSEDLRNAMSEISKSK